MKIFGYNITKEKRDVNGVKTQVPDAVVTNPYGGGGLGLNFEQYKGGSASNLSAFFRGVNLIADSVAAMPLLVKRENSDGYSDVIFNHYLYNLFDHNESQITRFEMIKQLIWSVIMRGNGYIYIYRDNTGKAKGFRWLHPDDVTIFYDKMKNVLYYQSVVVSKKRIEPVNMIHIKLFSDDGIIGKSLVSYANRSVTVANNTENSAANFFQSGCNLNGIIKVEGSLTPQQKQDIRDSWRDSVGTQGGGIGVLQGNMSYTPVQMTVADAQLVESRQFTVVDIARWLGINPTLLGDLSHSSYNTLEASQNEFYIHTLMPYVTLIEEEFTNKIFVPSEKGYYINFDENSILRSDKEKQADYYSTLLDKGVLSINEVRQALGYKEIEGGDAHTIAYSDPTQNAVDKNNENKEDNNE